MASNDQDFNFGVTQVIGPESKDEFDNVNVDCIAIGELELNYSMFHNTLAQHTPAKTVSQNNWVLDAFNCCI